MSRIEADGSSVRTIDDRLVVAMTFAHAQCMADAGPGENTAVPSPHGCIWVVLVDAGSGHMLTSMSAGMPG